MTLNSIEALKAFIKLNRYFVNMKKNIILISALLFIGILITVFANSMIVKEYNLGTKPEGCNTTHIPPVPDLDECFANFQGYEYDLNTDSCIYLFSTCPMPSFGSFTDCTKCIKKFGKNKNMSFDDLAYELTSTNSPAHFEKKYFPRHLGIYDGLKFIETYEDNKIIITTKDLSQDDCKSLNYEGKTSNIEAELVIKGIPKSTLGIYTSCKLNLMYDLSTVKIKKGPVVLVNQS